MTRPDSRGGWSVPDPEDPEPGEPHPFRVGPRYRVVDVVARGGMGEVVIARDHRLGREVALKRIVSDRDGADPSRRLAREAWITARLEHPSIVPVHDAGEDEDGELFYTMRLVHGRSLAEALAETLDTTQRAALLRHYLAACEAVAYAHSHGVVHRDLKPANIMVGAFGETQVVDWGLASFASEAAARAFEGDGGPPAIPTLGVVGTPGYMSPEQARGEPVDPRADVWALGVILDELVGGSRWGARPGGRELRAIIERATHVDARRRYRDAGELAADVARLLDGRRVHAHAYSTLELAGRIAHRHRVPLFVLASGVIAAVLVMVASFHRIDSARRRAIAAERETHQALADQQQTSASALARQAVTELENGALPEAEVLAAHALIHGESADARGVIAAVRAAPRLAGASVVTLPGCERVVPGTWHVAICKHVDGVSLWDLGARTQRWRTTLLARHVELVEHAGAIHVLALVGPDELVMLDGTTGVIVQRSLVDLTTGTADWIVASRDGRYAAVGNNQIVTTLAFTDGRLVQHGRACSEAGIAALGAGRHGFILVCRDGVIRELDLDAGTLAIRLAGTSRIRDLAPTAIAVGLAARTVVVGGARGEVVYADLETAEISMPRTVIDGPIVGLAALSDGLERIVISGETSGTGIWDLTTGTELARLPTATNDVRLDARGLISGGRLAGRWELPATLRPRTWLAPSGISAVAATTRYLAAARGDGKVSIWDTESGRLVTELALGEGVVKAVEFSPDGGELAVALSVALHPPQRFATASWTALPLTEVRRPARRLAYTRAGLIAVHFAPPLSSWDADGTLHELASPEMIDMAPGPDRDGAWLLAIDGGVWRLKGHALREVARDPNATTVAAWGDLIATGHGDGVRILDPRGQIRWLVNDGGKILDLIISSDGRYLFAGRSDGSIAVWRLADDTLIATLRGHQQRVAHLAFAPDGRLASAGWDGRVVMWDLSRLESSGSQLVSEAERAWALDLEMALHRPR